MKGLMLLAFSAVSFAATASDPGFEARLKSARKDSLAAVAMQRVFQLDDQIAKEGEGLAADEAALTAAMARMNAKYPLMQTVPVEKIQAAAIWFALQPEREDGKYDVAPEVRETAAAAVGADCGNAVWCDTYDNCARTEFVVCSEFYADSRQAGLILKSSGEHLARTSYLKGKRREAQALLKKLTAPAAPEAK